MAQFIFYVGRKGNPGVKCTAEVPSAKDVPSYQGGTVKVRIEEGAAAGTVVEATLTSALDMVVQAMTIQLQNAVRDTVYPPTGDTKGSTKRATGFVG